MTPDELRAEAEKMLLECVDLVQRTCSLTAARNRLIAFAQQYAAHVEKRARLEGRIEEASDAVRVMERLRIDQRGKRAGRECAELMEQRIVALRAELAALADPPPAGKRDAGGKEGG